MQALIRELAFKSTKLLPTNSVQELTQFDCKTHQLLGLRKLISFNSLYIVTRGQFTCPARSFFVFVHNHPLEPEYLKSHPLIKFLKNVKTKEALLEKIEEERKLNGIALSKMLPKVINQDKGSLLYHLVEFDHSFYTELFCNSAAKAHSELDPYRLRLCAFVDLLRAEERRTVEFL